MNKPSLEHAFNSYFHDKYSFSDFCNLDINSQYTEVFLSKNTFSPSKKLKKYQQFLNYFIFDYLSVNELVVFSYRKGVSAIDAINPHKDSKYIYTTDIKSFFRHLEVDKIKDLILKNKNNYLINEESVDMHLDNILNIITYKDLLPIGAPTSPKISNAYLLSFDNMCVDYCKENNIIYTRYSDDLIFSSNQKEIFNDFSEVVQNLLFHLGFNSLILNQEKTRIQHHGYRVKLLGLVIMPNGHISVERKVKKNIEVLLHFYLTDKEKFNEFCEKNFNASLERVSGILSHISSIDSKYIDKLKNKYGSFIINSFIHRDIADD